MITLVLSVSRYGNISSGVTATLEIELAKSFALHGPKPVYLISGI